MLQKAVVAAELVIEVDVAVGAKQVQMGNYFVAQMVGAEEEFQVVVREISGEFFAVLQV